MTLSLGLVLPGAKGVDLLARDADRAAPSYRIRRMAKCSEPPTSNQVVDRGATYAKFFSSL